MKKYLVKINNINIEIIQDDDGKFIKPNLCIEDWGKFGTSLKPAYEPIIMARKPIEGTVADNILKYGVGAINIDECRIGDDLIKGGTMPNLRDVGQKQKEISGINKLSFEQVENAKRKECADHFGRFPANIITDGSDEVKNVFPNTKPTKPHDGDGQKLDTRGTGWGFKRMPSYIEDNGGNASRCFYCAKASKKDRDEGLERGGDFQGMKVNDGRNTPIDNPFQRGETIRKNIHPT